jgi:transposase-like protein
LEAWVRGKVQEFVQAVLEEEVTEVLGRRRYERRDGVDAPVGHRNGYGKARRLALQTGTIVVRRPRVRGLEERFECRLLPLFVRRSERVADLLPELYLHGLAQGDFELALRGLLGDGAPLSAKSIERLRAKFDAEYERWKARLLDDRELVYAWADGIYVRAGLEQEKAALLVIIGAMRDGRKEVLAGVPGYRESTDSWCGVLRDLRDRGLSAPKLVVAAPPACGRPPPRCGRRPRRNGAGTTRSSTCSISFPAPCSPRRGSCSPRSLTPRRVQKLSAGGTPSRRRMAARTRKPSRSSSRTGSGW